MPSTNVWHLIDYLNVRGCVPAKEPFQQWQALSPESQACLTQRRNLYRMIAAGSLVGAALTEGNLRWGLLVLAGVSWLQDGTGGSW